MGHGRQLWISSLGPALAITLQSGYQLSLGNMQGCANFQSSQRLRQLFCLLLPTEYFYNDIPNVRLTLTDYWSPACYIMPKMPKGHIYAKREKTGVIDQQCLSLGGDGGRWCLSHQTFKYMLWLEQHYGLGTMKIIIHLPKETDTTFQLTQKLSVFPSQQSASGSQSGLDPRCPKYQASTRKTLRWGNTGEQQAKVCTDLQEKMLGKSSPGLQFAILYAHVWDAGRNKACGKATGCPRRS